MDRQANSPARTDTVETVVATNAFAYNERPELIDQRALKIVGERALPAKFNLLAR